VRRCCRILVAAAVLAPAALRAQELYEQPVAFPDLLRARIDAGVGFGNLPLVAKGVDIDEPAVFLTVTTNRIYLHGEPLLRLENGVPATDILRMCKARVPCSPVLRNGIVAARSVLAAAFGHRPPVVIIADPKATYPALLLVARSAAEAGAQLSIRVAARTRNGDLVGVPILVTPGRTLSFGRSQMPALLTLDVRGDAVAIRATREYMEQPEWARNLADMQEIIGRIQLHSGRRLCFLAAEAPTTAGEAVAVIDAARDVFEYVALTDSMGVRAEQQP